MVTTPAPYAGDTTRSPIVACIVGTIVSCILAAGIIVVHIPAPAPLWGSVMWVGIAAALTVATIVLIFTKRQFARELFFTVAKWVFLYILVLTGMGEYVLGVRRHERWTARRHDRRPAALPGQYPDAVGLLGRASPAYTRLTRAPLTRLRLPLPSPAPR